MRYSNQGWFREQASFLRRQFLQDGDLPFSNVLSEEVVAQALTAISACWLDRIYSPLITLWVFLSQVLSQDHSCRAAVARLIAHRVSRGQSPCSSETGAYCQARKRLPEEFFSSVARQTGRALEKSIDPQWLWKSRRVYVYDGSSVSMPDTPANQRDYPQPDTQKHGLGFPLARIAAVFSLACGAVLDVGICRYAGKGQSELGMLRTLWNLFFPGDVLLADRLMCAWTEMVMLKQRGIDCVCHLTSHRRADFRRGKCLGKDDHIVKWLKPTKPRSIDRETYNTLPEFLIIRECRFQIELLAPRFLASAFVSGPAFLVVTMILLRRLGRVPIPRDPIHTLVQIIRVAILINLLMVVSELFTEFYTGAAHSKHAYYLFFGLHGHYALVPWIWSSLALNLFAAALFLHPRALRNTILLVVACGAAFVGIWIEKGMGLIIPGFVPSNLDQLVEYQPSLMEWQITAGIWAFGLMVYTVALKIAIPVMRGEVNFAERRAMTSA